MFKHLMPRAVGLVILVILVILLPTNQARDDPARMVGLVAEYPHTGLYAPCYQRWSSWHSWPLPSRNILAKLRLKWNFVQVVRCDLPQRWVFDILSLFSACITLQPSCRCTLFLNCGWTWYGNMIDLVAITRIYNQQIYCSHCSTPGPNKRRSQHARFVTLAIRSAVKQQTGFEFLMPWRSDKALYKQPLLVL